MSCNKDNKQTLCKEVRNRTALCNRLICNSNKETICNKEIYKETICNKEIYKETICKGMFPNKGTV